MEKDNQNEVPPVVQNVISVAKIDVWDLNLPLLAEKVAGSRYNRKRYPALIMRKIAERSTVLLFSNGSMVIVGSPSEADAEVAARKSIKDIEKVLSIKVKLINFQVVNIVASACLGYKLDLGRLCEERGVIRNQNFPGVVYKKLEHVKSAQIFSSGKVILTGAIQVDSVENAFTELKRKMHAFRKL